MSDSIEMTPEARWRHLRENGKTPVDISNDRAMEVKPEWFDELRWARAKEAVQKYYVGVGFSSFTGLLLILQLPEGLEPLLSTGNSKDIPSLHRRYLNTMLHVRSWYEEDIFNPESKGHKSIRQVRAMHKRVQSLMNERFKVADEGGKQRYWYNEYDVALTQFAFIGLAMIYPEKSGMILATRQELEDINYCWRVLGHMMGIKDEFNACGLDKYEDIVAFNKLVLQHEYLDYFATTPCEKGLNMTKSICLALKYYMPMLTFNLLAHWWSDCFKFNGYEPQPMSGRERLLDFVNRLSFSHLMKYDTFLRLTTKLQKKRFEQRVKNKDKAYEEVKKKYGNCPEHTYYSDRADYLDGSQIQLAAMANNYDFNGQVEQQQQPAADDENNKGAKLALGSGCPFGFEAKVMSPSDQVTGNGTPVVASA